MYRKQFYPRLKTRVYLNHAAVSPLCHTAQQSMQALIDHYVTEGMGAWTGGFGYRRRARQNLARLIGAEPDQIGLTQNTTTGIMMVAQEFPWKAGDRMILVKGEFPGNVVPWLLVAKERKLHVDWVTPEDVIECSANLLRALSQKPKLLALSWVQYQTGMTQSLTRLANYRREFGVQICLDAIQGLGALPINVSQTPLDYIVCGGHKWLLGPEGTGFVYIHPERMNDLEPKMVGWLSQTEPLDFLIKGSGHVDYHKPYRQEANRIEMASMSNVLYAGMAEATQIFMDLGSFEVSRMIRDLANYTRTQLEAAEIPFCNRYTGAGIVSIPLGKDDLARCLQAFKQEDISIGSPDGHVRISPHFYNTRDDVDEAISVLRHCF